MQPARQSKLLGLEILRFISAIAVLFWHYQHFAFVADKPVDFVTEAQPLYRLFLVFYRYGFYGVQVFWCISGFIFFWKYRTAIADGAIGAGRFFVLRFSRLYPLHFATMLLVGLLQLVYFAQRGYYFVYQHNDFKHLVLNLFLASHWGWQDGYSFNAPIWSISVEVLVYLLFFVVLRLLGRSVWVSAAVLLACTLAKWHWGSQVFPAVDAVAYFFAGGMAAVAYGRWASSRALNYALLGAALAAPVGLWLANRPHDQVAPMFLLAYLPALLFLLARDLRVPPHWQQLIEAAGNMTYSSYLIHFPIQLALALVCNARGVAIPYHSVGFFALFMSASLLAAYFLYRWFELPAQARLRRQLL
ncbi:acyltransferase [Duganella sp.]|uniref:acyltransferase family protein n=1 Tax=Duganella sp. TaxID=1904440 RepID=UPI0031DB2735